MDRRKFLQNLSAAVATGVLPFGASCASKLPWRGRPNIVLIMADDLGYGDLGITGRRDYATSAIDSIARDGVWLRQAYSAAPVCTPTRVALATGRYPARSAAGLYEPLTSQPTGLDTSPPTLAMLLKQVGYRTSLVGKWHLGLAPEYHPLKHGYDDFYGFLGAAADYRSHIDTETRRHLFVDGEAPARSEGYLTDLFTDRAVSIIARDHAAPFFLNLQYNAPHWPWQGPKDPVYPDSLPWVKGGSPEIFAAMVESMDAGVARVLAALEEQGLERETLVIFTSDNGGERFSHMGPFSQSKMTLYEGGVRVAAMARWPGVIPAGTTSDQVAVTMDWTATILQLAGARAAQSAALDGIDLLPALTGLARSRERELFWRIFQRRKQKAARIGDWKYLQTDAGEFLFNLSSDQAEQRDLRAREPATFDRVKNRMTEWEKQVLQPIPLDPAFA